MRDKIRFDEKLTIEQMAEEAMREHPELSEMGKKTVTLAIARYVSSSVDWNYTAKRFNYLKDLVDSTYKSLNANGKQPTAEDVSKAIDMEGLTPELAGFLHHQEHRDIASKKKKRSSKNNKAETQGNVKSTDEQALKEIIDLYLPKGQKTFDCDLTYGEGLFYKHLPQPKEKYDLYPQGKDVHPLEELYALQERGESKEYSSIVIDLPDIVKSPSDNKKSDKEDKEEKKAKRDNNTFQSLIDLYASYKGTVWIAHYHLAQNGILIFKAPDILIRDNKDKEYENMWTADYAVDVATDYGLALVDEIVLVENDDAFPTGTSLKTLTRHGKRFHVFLIFKKL